jgi:hypothetical protein
MYRIIIKYLIQWELDNQKTTPNFSGKTSEKNLAHSGIWKNRI